MSKLISIIVPIYNTEKYLHRCINSILNQTYSNLEVILINDGSTDGSDAICRKYASKDKRIKYIIQDNHGQGYTRAKGINLANGDYVAFADSDDYMKPEAYGTMLLAMMRDGTDMCACQWNYELPNGKHTINNRIYDDSFYGVKSSTEFARYLYKYSDLERAIGYGYANGVVVSPWNKLYRRSFLLGFESNGYIGEDEEMNDYILSNPNVRVSVIRDELYYWCQNLNSISNSPFSEKRWHFLNMLAKRSRLYTDEYVVRETHKLICNMTIEYYYKSLASEITPPNP